MTSRQSRAGCTSTQRWQWPHVHRALPPLGAGAPSTECTPSRSTRHRPGRARRRRPVAPSASAAAQRSPGAPPPPRTITSWWAVTAVEIVALPTWLDHAAAYPGTDRGNGRGGTTANRTSRRTRAASLGRRPSADNEAYNEDEGQAKGHFARWDPSRRSARRPHPPIPPRRVISEDVNRRTPDQARPDRRQTVRRRLARASSGVRCDEIVDPVESGPARIRMIRTDGPSSGPASQ
jgi:hypothetical protein